MFSGIVEELGQLKEVSRRGGITLLKINSSKVSQDVKIGDSISVNGVCLSLINKCQDTLSFEVMSQTLKVSNLGFLRIKEKVNLERALKIGDRLSGHFVTGHIDCLGLVRKKHYFKENLCFKISIPVKFIPYLIPKGSVAVDGISLTVAEQRSGTFSVYIIPHTLKYTTLSFKGPSDKVNIEFDALAKRMPF